MRRFFVLVLKRAVLLSDLFELFIKLFNHFRRVLSRLVLFLFIILSYIFDTLISLFHLFLQILFFFLHLKVRLFKRRNSFFELFRFFFEFRFQKSEVILIFLFFGLKRVCLILTILKSYLQIDFLKLYLRQRILGVLKFNWVLFDLFKVITLSFLQHFNLLLVLSQFLIFLR